MKNRKTELTNNKMFPKNDKNGLIKENYTKSASRPTLLTGHTILLISDSYSRLILKPDFPSPFGTDL